MGIQEPADDYETSPAVRGVILSALGIGRCYKNLEYTWIIAEQTDVSDLSAINHVIRTNVRTHFRRVPFLK